MTTLVQCPSSRLLHLRFLADVLWDVLEDVLFFWPLRTFYFSSIYRTPEHDKKLGGSGIHSTIPHRAIDIRTRALSPARLKALAARINKLWIYDPSRPHLKVAVYKPHGTGPHLHLQVFPGRTKRVQHAESDT